LLFQIAAAGTEAEALMGIGQWPQKKNKKKKKKKKKFVWGK
jgi:hypothetical protein